jgi:hypothetical protein
MEINKKSEDLKGKFDNLMETPKRTGKVLEYKTYRGCPVVVYEYSYKNNQLVKNPKFEEHKKMISGMAPGSVLYQREYDLKDGIKPRMDKTFVRTR